MDNADILIVGAGAAGLMAAYTLTKAGKKVIVLEARNRCGGRIHTINNEMFFKHAELGAEFVHGDLPVTLKLLKEARIAYTNINAEMLNVKEGHFDNQTEFHDEWAQLIEVLEQLEDDTTIDALLKKEFHGGEYIAFKKSVINFVSGYDTANPLKASVFALLKEWKSEDNSAQHRVKGGYSRMINYLHQQTEKNNGSVLLNSTLREIHWQPGSVTAITTEGEVYNARQILIAVPLGILQANPDEQGAIIFDPPIAKQHEAIQSMGFGAVIKILLIFSELFWEGKRAEEVAGVSLKKMGYLLSHEAIPTWWTQYPDNTPVITGWLGGPGAAEKKDATEDEILSDALQSLANIFKLDVEELKTKLIAFNIVNWTKEPFTHGSYAYDTIQSPASRKLLNEPINNTLFFAGEYLYDGPAMGTVEAALTSGEQAAGRMILVD